MTCIIGYIDKRNDCIWMGCDSLGSNGYTKSINNASKVFHSEIVDSVIMGGTGSFRNLDLLKYSDKLFDKVDKYEIPSIDHKYMVTKFIPKVINLFKDGVIDQDERNKGINFIIGMQNQLFEIQADYSVLIPNDGYCAVGCGEDVAYGSLYSTKNNEDISIPKKIEIALESAENHCCGVQRPFKIINTKDDKEIVIK